MLGSLTPHLPAGTRRRGTSSTIYDDVVCPTAPDRVGANNACVLQSRSLPLSPGHGRGEDVTGFRFPVPQRHEWPVSLPSAAPESPAAPREAHHGSPSLALRLRSRRVPCHATTSHSSR